MSNDESKPYYKEYMRDKSNPEYSATDALCWDVIDRRVRSGEVISEAGINTYIEHPDQKDPSHWWVITTPNAGHVPTAPIGIQQLQARADGRFGLDDRTLHPQMYVLGFEYICCIPRKDESRRMLWWTPTLADCPVVPNSPFRSRFVSSNRSYCKGIRSFATNTLALSANVKAATAPHLLVFW